MVGTLRASTYVGSMIGIMSVLVLAGGGCGTACQDEGLAGGSCKKGSGAISGGGGESGATETADGSSGGAKESSDGDASGTSGGSGEDGSTSGQTSGAGPSTDTGGDGSGTGGQPPSPACVGEYTVTQAVATGHHAGCEPATASNWTDCAAAANRYCMTALDPECGTVSGFAAEFDAVNDAMSVTCVPGEDFQVDYAVLAAQHESCSGASASFPDMYGIFCNSAIHRYCQAIGYETGFGPVEVGLPTGFVHCIRSEHATVIGAALAALTAQNGDCTDPLADLHACQSASRRYCVSAGHAGGYGPVEAGESNVTIVCVD